jgi:hypothetical protein
VLLPVYDANSSNNSFASFNSRVEAFGEPAVDRSQQFASLLHLALVAPEACEAHGGAEFPGLCLLRARYREGTLEISFRFRDGSGDMSAMTPAIRLTSASVHLSFVALIVFIASPM